jgi:lipid-binding SYLF domain-containing protein
MRRHFLTVLMLVCAGMASAEWHPDPTIKKQVASAEAIAQIKERIPRSQPFFDDAWGMAIYPSVTRLGFGFGGAFGKGYVIEGDTIIATSRYWQFTGGIQAGVRNFSMVILFKNQAALEDFKNERIEFVGQSGLAAGTKGVAGTPAYTEDVVIFTITRLGLMGEFTYSGARFTYRPLLGVEETEE